MSNAKQIYDENIGHSHEAAIGAVYGAGFKDGQAAGVVEVRTETLDPNPELQAQAAKAEQDLADATAANAELTAELAAAKTSIEDLTAHIVSLTPAKE
jgi:hypothetical protein